MDLQALREKSATVRFEFDGEWLTYTYNPHQYDDECQRILNDMPNQPDNTALSGIFERLITSWDLKDGGRDVPCTYEMYHNLPPFLRSKIVNTIVEDEMERGKLNRSDNGSNRQAPQRSALVPIGTRRTTTSEPADSENGVTS